MRMDVCDGQPVCKRGAVRCACACARGAARSDARTRPHACERSQVPTPTAARACTLHFTSTAWEPSPGASWLPGHFDRPPSRGLVVAEAVVVVVSLVAAAAAAAGSRRQASERPRRAGCLRVALADPSPAPRRSATPAHPHPAPQAAGASGTAGPFDEWGQPRRLSDASWGRQSVGGPDANLAANLSAAMQWSGQVGPAPARPASNRGRMPAGGNAWVAAGGSRRGQVCGSGAGHRGPNVAMPRPSQRPTPGAAPFAKVPTKQGPDRPWHCASARPLCNACACTRVRDHRLLMLPCFGVAPQDGRSSLGFCCR